MSPGRPSRSEHCDTALRQSGGRARSCPASSVSCLAVSRGLVVPEGEPVAGFTGRAGSNVSAGGVERAVEEHVFDPDVVVEPLKVPEIGDGRGGVGVEMRGTVSGDLEAQSFGYGGRAQPDGDASAAGDVCLLPGCGIRRRWTPRWWRWRGRAALPGWTGFWVEIRVRWPRRTTPGVPGWTRSWRAGRQACSPLPLWPMRP